jgi:hypothetical protein
MSPVPRSFAQPTARGATGGGEGRAGENAHAQTRMSTSADSRKHSLGVTRPEGLSQTGGGPNEHRQQAECSHGHKARGPVADGWRATHRTCTATPRMHAQSRLTETRWEWPSTRPRSQAHGKTIAVRGNANQWSRRARPATCKAEGRVAVAMPSGPGMAEGDNLRRSRNARKFSQPRTSDCTTHYRESWGRPPPAFNKETPAIFPDADKRGMPGHD